MKKKPVIIALCGKGGVGKTSISALLTKYFVENTDGKVLAIDADPAIGLSYPLGITVNKTVDTIRNDLIRQMQNNDATSKAMLLRQLDYELFDAIEEKENLAFLAVGRPEGDGCYCQVNSLLKSIIHDVASRFDYVIIDGEAGIEQINRRVMEMVTHLFLVSDASAKGRNVATTINAVAKKNTGIKNTGLFFNRLADQHEAGNLKASTDLNVIGWLPENNTIRSCDKEGGSFFSMDDTLIMPCLITAMEGFVHGH